MRKMTGVDFSLPNLELKNIKVVKKLKTGTRIIENAGDSSVQWEIPKGVFEATYLRDEQCK